MKNSHDAFINRNFEECINLNDEHNGLTTNLSYSPYRAVFNEEIVKWKKGLETASEVLEGWMKLQLG